MEEQYTEGCSEESCAGCSHSGSCESQKQNAGNTAPSKAPANVGSQVKKVIGVISGKGGVGKSLVTASLARMMIEKGYTAGILNVGDEVQVKVIGIKDGKISLSMKALEEPEEEVVEKVEIPKAEEIGTSLGDLFKNIQL